MGFKHFRYLEFALVFLCVGAAAGCGREGPDPAPADAARDDAERSLALATQASATWPIVLAETFDRGFEASGSAWTPSGPGSLESIDDQLCTPFTMQLYRGSKGFAAIYHSQWANLTLQDFSAKDLRIEVDLTPTTIYAVSEVRFRNDATTGDHYKLKIYKDNTMAKAVTRAELWMIKADNATLLAHKGINAAKATYVIQADGAGISVRRDGKAFLSSKEKTLAAGAVQLSGWYGGCFDALEIRSPESI